MKALVSFIIPTRNEERNIRGAIASVAEWANEVFVLDSFSTDRTVELARSLGAKVAQREFDNFAAQKNWALDNLPLGDEWVFFLDADERVTPELREEITGALSRTGYDGFYVPRRNFFMGVALRHGPWAPDWNLRFFKHRLGRYEQRIVHEHVILSGRAAYMHNPLEHNDYKGLDRYFERHNVYSSMEAVEVFRTLNRLGDGALEASPFTRGPRRRRWLKNLAYRYLPCRTLFKFVWAYLLKGGFLDGRLGFRYCLLQTFYEYQVSLKLRELRSDPTSSMFEKYPAFRTDSDRRHVTDVVAQAARPELESSAAD